MDTIGEIPIEWIAGFFDGEGCISLTLMRKTPVIWVGVSQKDRTVLDEISEEWGGKIYRLKKGTHVLKWNMEETVKILSAMLPYLRTARKKRAELILSLLSQAPGKGYKWDQELVKKTLHEFRRI